MRNALAALLGAALLCPSPASAQERLLTLPEALSIARARAAEVTAAAGQLEEARARLSPAGRRLRENPVLELDGGHRQAEETYTDYAVSLSQGLEPSARRNARLAGAEAAVEVARNEFEDVRREYLGEVAATFLRAAAAQERLRLAAASSQLAADLRKTIERRYEMGEITALELNRARIAAARAEADLSFADGDRLGAMGSLRAVLGLEPGAMPVPSADLRELPAYDLDGLLARAAERPDLLALAAAAREADAEVRLGESLARPDFGLWTGYEREEGADVVSAGIAISLPLFRKGQEERAVGQARGSRLRARQEAGKRAAEAEVRAAFEAYRQRVRAVETLAAEALPAVEDNEALARRSFEVGEINLGDLLAVRREILETRLSHLDLTLEARLAAVELETKAGAFR